MNHFYYIFSIAGLGIFFLFSCVCDNDDFATIEQLVGEEYKEVGLIRQDAFGNELEYKYYGLHHLYFYNKKKQLIRVSDISEPNNVYDETLNTYDTNGNLIKTQLFNDNKNILLESKMTYNEQDQLVLESTTSTFAAAKSVEYHYGKTGKLIQEIRTKKNEVTTIKYQYDADTNLQLEEFFNAGKISLSYTHTYDKNGNRIKTLRASGIKREVFMTKFFTYNAQNQKILEKCDCQIQGICNTDQYWTYNSQGLMTREYEKIGDKLFNDKRYLWK